MAGNGMRIRWGTVGTLVGVLLTVATLFGTGMATWGGDRALLYQHDRELKMLREHFDKRMTAIEDRFQKHLDVTEPIVHRFIMIEQGVKDLTKKLEEMETRNVREFADLKQRLERYGFVKP